jgi:hypothetical protein
MFSAFIRMRITRGMIPLRKDGSRRIMKQEILPEYTGIAEKYVYGSDVKSADNRLSQRYGI